MFSSHFVVRCGGFFCYAIITLSHYNIKKYVHFCICEVFLVPSDTALAFMCLSIANNFIGLGGRAYPVRYYPIAIRLRDRNSTPHQFTKLVGDPVGRAILCVALISSEWGLFGYNTRSAIRGTSSPRSYCHPTQPILQLRSHYFVENTASPSLKSHPPAHLRASSQ